MGTYALIRSSRPPVCELQDEIIWTAAEGGQFSIRTVMPTRLFNQASWFDLIWFKGHIGKHYICAWMSFRNALKIRVLLATRGVTQEVNCPLYNSNQEDCFHLFSCCSYNTSVWNSIMLRTRSTPTSFDSIEGMARFLLNNADQSREANTTLARLCFSALAWNIWRERNRRVFQSKSKPWEVVLKETLYHIRSRTIFLNLDVSQELAALWNLPEINRTRGLNTISSFHS